MEKRPLWFRIYGRIVRLFTSRPRFVYLGEQVNEPSLILTNHEAAAGPLTWEFYFDRPKRFWSAHEMTEGLLSVFRYLAYLYFPEKKHFGRVLSPIFAFFAAPFVSLFFTGLKPVPTYRDASGFIRTVRESCDTVTGGRSILLFPEDSSHGYAKRLGTIHSGFVVFCERMLRKGVDLPVFVAFYSKKKRVILVDAPIRYSALRESCRDRDAVADALRVRLNELADIVEKEA